MSDPINKEVVRDLRYSRILSNWIKKNTSLFLKKKKTCYGEIYCSFPPNLLETFGILHKNT